MTVLHCVANALVRRSGWWRPADEFNRNLKSATFGLGVLLLSGLVFRAAPRSSTPTAVGAGPCSAPC